MSQVHPPLTILSGVYTPIDSLHAIGRSMEFLSSAVFAMWVHCDEELKDQGEGLQHLLAHLATLQSHSSQLCDQQMQQLSKSNEILEQQLGQYQQLCALHQNQDGKVKKPPSPEVAKVAEDEDIIIALGS